MSEFFSVWRLTPWWLRILGKPKWMRDRYASPMIGGGWDGWDFADVPAVSKQLDGDAA